MSGTLVNVLGMTKLDFSDLGASGTVQVPLAQNIDLSRHAKGALLVRVHEKNITGTASVVLGLIPVLPSPEDPSKVFKATSSLASLTIDANTAAAPLLLIDGLAEPIGAYGTLVVLATQASSPADIELTISVELSLTD